MNEVIYNDIYDRETVIGHACLTCGVLVPIGIFYTFMDGFTAPHSYVEIHTNIHNSEANK